MKYINQYTLSIALLSITAAALLLYGIMSATDEWRRAETALVKGEETLAAAFSELQYVQEQLEALRAANAALPECVRVQVGTLTWGGEAILGIGETALCASKAGRLVWVNKVYGPAFDEENSLAAAWDEASRWRDCAHYLQYCPEGFERGK